MPFTIKYDQYERHNFISQLQALLKTEGLSKQSVEVCEKILDRGQTPRLKQFKQAMKEYFQQTLACLPSINTVLCSSDILESCFGKYKYYLQDNPMTGITNLSLSMAAFTATLDDDELMNAFEETRVRHVEEWTAINIGKTTLAKRKEVFKSGG